MFPRFPLWKSVDRYRRAFFYRLVTIEHIRTHNTIPVYNPLPWLRINFLLERFEILNFSTLKMSPPEFHIMCNLFLLLVC